ncbi:hypothetical protein OUZ56_031773 [Daphnia magna]|uniref:Uncharacterized protein n=1 Tax=Daphnia magna TaxID=35525 RepID=A0ABQ9ZV61_9CRUS|nr:hypothetical protein OUZ56_031773 [Daphnia magna]
MASLDAADIRSFHLPLPEIQLTTGRYWRDTPLRQHLLVVAEAKPYRVSRDRPRLPETHLTTGRYWRDTSYRQYIPEISWFSGNRGRSLRISDSDFRKLEFGKLSQ